MFGNRAKGSFTLIGLLVMVMMSIPNAKVTANTNLWFSSSLPVKVKIVAPQTGQEAFLSAVLMQKEVIYSEEYPQTQEAYEIQVPTSILNSLVDSKQSWDSTYAVKVTIWMHYDKIYQDHHEYTNARRYEAKWELYDSSVRLRDAQMRAGAAGAILGGGYYTPHVASKWIGTPSLGRIYTLWVPWDVYINTTTAETGYQAGNSQVTLQRGSTQWDLFICIYQSSCAELLLR